MTRRYGAGTVYQRADGRWIGQWSAGRRDDGSRNRGTTKPAETEAAAWKLLAAVRSSSTKPRRGGETVAAFLERWLVDVVRTNRRERTYWGYRSIVDLHLVPAFGARELRAVTRREVQTWVAGQKASPVSVRHRVDCLRSAMSYAVRWGLIDANPATDLDLPSVPKRAVRALRPEDARKLLDATAREWFAPLVTVALYTGLRQGELLGLRWEDVNLGGPVLTVHHALARLPGKHGVRYVLDAPKSPHSRRTVPLAPPAVAALREHQKAQLRSGGSWKGLVFAYPDRPIDGTWLTHEFQAALARAKLPAMRWHDLRHGWVSLMLESGVSLIQVSRMAGHAGIAITSDVYGHLTQEGGVESIEKLARRIG